MKGLTKIGAVLVAVFAFSLVALLAELTYVLWRRRRFRLRNLSGGSSQIYGSEPFNTPPSKELLYFFCWKSQSRVEPSGAPSPPHLPEPENEEAKWQLGILYGPSRVLFTIKEEEREGAETENCSSSAETDHRVKRSKRVSLDECFAEVSFERDTGLVPEDGVAVTIDNFNDEEATPFSTPCASPPYYTPSPSPSRDGTTLNYSPENDVSSPESTGGSKSGIVCLEVEGY